MATNLKEYVRESFIEYITIFKASFAKINGDATESFDVKSPTADDHAVTRRFGYDNYAPKSHGHPEYALEAGDDTVKFKVADPTADKEAVNKAYAESNFIPATYTDITSTEAQSDYDNA